MRRVRDVDATGPGSAALANAPIADTCTVGRAPPWSRRGKSSTSRRLRRAAGAGGAGSAARDATRRGAHFSLLPSRAPSPWKKGLPGDAGRDLSVARGSGPDRASGRTVAVIQRLGPGPPRILAGGGARHRVHPGRAPGPREDSLSRRTTAAIFAGRVRGGRRGASVRDGFGATTREAGREAGREVRARPRRAACVRGASAGAPRCARAGGDVGEKVLIRAIFARRARVARRQESRRSSRTRRMGI